jgi:hypothetical protein
MTRLLTCLLLAGLVNQALAETSEEIGRRIYRLAKHPEAEGELFALIRSTGRVTIDDQVVPASAIGLAALEERFGPQATTIPTVDHRASLAIVGCTVEQVRYRFTISAYTAEEQATILARFPGK